MIDVISLSTPELGDRSYVIHDGQVGVAVDPQRDTDRLVRAATVAGVRITYVAETHIHNDYVSGGWALAQQLEVPYLVAASEEVAFEHRPVRDGDEIPLGDGFSLRVLATPGHTPHHVAYVGLDRGRPVVACTGGSLLFGSVGRTDLLGTAQAKPLAHQQYRSAHLLGRLPALVEVLPTHGFGSFWTVRASAVEASTIEEQRRSNLVFRSGDEDSFVETLLATFGDYPRYYHRMAGVNRQGARASALVPPRLLDSEQVLQMTGRDTWVVDVRGRGAFAARHLAGTINFELDRPFSNYLGWLLPDDRALVVMAESPKAVAVAQVDLSRIGIDELAGQYVGPLSAFAAHSALRSYPVRGFADLAKVISDQTNVALDVRRQDEWEEAHLDGAWHIPLHHLEQRLHELPPGTIWVHCAAGYRAAIAASLLERRGRNVVLVDGRFTPAID
jgi:hydroxyacylglutathione hydrolase